MQNLSHPTDRPMQPGPVLGAKRMSQAHPVEASNTEYQPTTQHQIQGRLTTPRTDRCARAEALRFQGQQDLPVLCVRLCTALRE